MDTNEGGSDESVVAAVLGGERDRYAVLVARYQRRIYGALWRMCGNSYDAEELTQVTFVRAYFALGSYKPAYKFSTWLFQIAFHLYLNEKRKHRRELEMSSLSAGDDTPTIEAADPDALPGTVVEARETQGAIWRAVASLPEDFRQVIIMRHVEELSYHEICEATGLPIGTVKSRLARARQQLARLLSEEAEDEPR